MSDRLRQFDQEREAIGGLVKEARREGGAVWLEIGPGEVRVASLKRGDVWVGVDPVFNGVEVGERDGVVKVDDVGRLPEFVPDVVLVVASDPNDIDNGMLWDYERFIVRAKVVVVVVDTRTSEALSGPGVSGLIRKIMNDLREMGREVRSGWVGETIRIAGRQIDLSLSGDLGSRSEVVYSWLG